jgi:hypothetical protein
MRLGSLRLALGAHGPRPSVVALAGAKVLLTNKALIQVLVSAPLPARLLLASPRNQDRVPPCLPARPAQHSTMDYDERDISEGFVFENPQAKGTCGCGESFF